ncbi:MAG TPA: protein kinase [Myxococcales bacterium]|nr:protein kinase [Myxococcales bacterium]
MSTTAKRQPVPFGKYLLLDRINIGGMAEVWRGKMFGAGGFERLVAIKRILPNIAEDEEFITMFIDEAKISVQLTHANIAQIYELGHINNSYFIAMEYIPGKDMRAIFERCRKKGEPAPIPLSCYVVSKLCEGLDYAHRKKDGMGRDMNIVHRDVSPQNVLISYEGEVKVIDFGIAKAAGKATKTQAGILKGKFGYMSPEQIRGLPLDRRSDVFAIGVCLYEMLTGERLFVGDSDFSVLEKVRKAEVTPPSTYNRRVPEQLEKIVLRALARDVDTRYQYANELADDLQRFLITSDSIFSRKDLMQYMKSTFAEEVEREKMRLQDYAEIKPPEGMAAAAEMGFGAAPNLASTSPRASNPGVGRAPTPAVAMNASPTPGKPTEPMVPAVRPADTLPPIRRTSMPGMPKLTAAAPVSLQESDTGSSNATQIAEGPGYEVKAEKGRDRDRRERLARTVEDSGARPSFAMDPEPATVPGSHRNKGGGAQVVGADGNGRWEPPNMAPARLRAGAGDEPDIPTGPMSFLGSGRARLVGLVGGAVGLVAIIAVAAVVLWPTPEGFVLVEPSPIPASARVKISDIDLGILEAKQWPVLQRVRAGPAVVLVTAEGYQTFVQPIEVQKGATPTKVAALLKRTVSVAQLFVLTEPRDAQVLLNGEVKRPEGTDSGQLSLEVQVGTEVTLEARKKGFRTVTEKVSPAEAGESIRKTLKLQPSELSVQLRSDPIGAEIWVNGKSVGQTTPAAVTLPAETTKVELKKKCFDVMEIPVDGQLDVSKPIVRKLVKLPSCK